MRHRRTPADTSVPPLLINRPADLWRGVPRLIAALCMIDFYSSFVGSGSWLWNGYLSHLYQGRLDWSGLWTEDCANLLADVVRAVVLLVLARSLWVNRPRLSLWAFVVLAVYPLLILLDLWTTHLQAKRSVAWGGFGIFTPPTYWQYMLNCLLSYSSEALLLAVILLDRRLRRSYTLAWSPWVSIASAYVLAFMLTQLSIRGYWLMVVGNWVSVGLIGQTLNWLQYCILVVPAIAVVLLLCGNSWAPVTCLSIGVMAIFYGLQGAWVITDLVRSAIVALLASSAYDAGPPPSMISLLLNQYAFDYVFIDAVAQGGPWLVLAWWGWTRPMRSPVVRGMVYPVRLCGRCGYNLHGLADRRCPECGATWTAQDEPRTHLIGDSAG